MSRTRAGSPRWPETFLVRRLHPSRRHAARAEVLLPRGTCACRKLNPGILVMQSAQGWATKNVPGAIDGARALGWRVSSLCHVVCTENLIRVDDVWIASADGI